MKSTEIIRLQKIEKLQANERHSEAYSEVRNWLNELPERKKVIVDNECAEIQEKITACKLQCDKHYMHIDELQATLKEVK